MNNVIAKIKRLRKKTFRKVLSDSTLFSQHESNIGDYPKYDPDHKLDEDSWFKIENFSSTKYFIDILDSDFDTKDIDMLSRDQFHEMTYLCSIQDEDFYFQKLTPSLFLSRKKVLHFGESVELQNKENGLLVINDEPDAVYKRALDTLIFKNLSSISSIFPEIDELFKEATQEQVVEFLGSNFISLAGEYSAERVSKPNRKRVALAMATLAEMTEEDRDNIFVYINEYCADKLKFDAQTKEFEISTDEELKNLFFGIEQRFYTTIIGGVRRLANSVQNLPS